MITMEANNETVEKLIEIADENNIAYDCCEGVLLDNYIFYGAENINVGKDRAKYIIVKERYINEWSSGFTLIMTNSDEEMESFKAVFLN